MENSPSMPWCSDSDTLPSSLSNCVTALFSFPLHPTAFDVSSFFDTKQHVTREVRCRLLASKAGKKTRRRGRDRGGQGCRRGGWKKTKNAKKKRRKHKKKIDRAHHDHQDNPPVCTNVHRKTLLARREGRRRKRRRRREPRIVHRDEMNEEETADTWSAPTRSKGSRNIYNTHSCRSRVAKY